MINEYIEKNKLMSHLFNKQDEDIDVMFEIANFNAEDVVSVSTYNQIRWERDIAMQQLEDYGIPFCSNIDTRVRNKLYNLECKNYEETNFERITASPGTLAKELSTMFSHGFGEIQILEWLNQSAKEE